ncbi:MAG: acyl-ACP--UDP-N-acetylglucosamine O-acyltransferase [Candidatus Omnitrophica bacterium]|nr:acyl-ACP--UDP-N-acetylglucosamine O-acyltransferase [Candidatus Omnitrophota bacterium]
MIHKTAIINPRANLGKGVSVGPNTIIGEFVTIGEGTLIGANCIIDGTTKIGKDCEIFTGAIIGTIAQDKKYKGGDTFLEIGDRNKIREYVTINLSTDNSDKTIIGNDNLLMAYSHIAHNCKIGNNNTLANSATLAGHVTIEDEVIIGGLTAIHQFVRIGKLAILGGCSKVVQDIVPYAMADGHPAKIYGVNSIGLSRRNIKPSTRLQLKKAFKILFYMKLNTGTAIEKIKKETEDCEEISCLIKFVKSSERGIAR